MSPEEYRIIARGRTLGTLPITFPLMPDMTIVFSGRRWRVVEVRDREKVIEVVPDATGRPPKFGGEPMDLHDAVATEMLAMYWGNDLLAYLDSTARELLVEGRDTFRRLRLDGSKSLNLSEKQTLLFPWRGTVATASLALALCWKGLRASARHIVIEVSGSWVDEVLTELAASPPPPAALLAGSIANLEREKYHPYLTRDLLIEDAGASRVDAEAVPEIAGALLQEAV